MTALRLHEVCVARDGRRLFAPLSVEISAGTVLSLLGASGTGKSSLLNYLCGVLPPGLSGAGSLFMDDEDLTRLPPERRRLGLLFQDPLLFPHLDVAGNLLFGMRGRASRAERRRRVEASLESVGLEGMSGRDPATLSGGQQARLALLRVLLAEPRALLLDEPFRSLDDAARQRVRELVFTEARRRELPTLLVTHDSSDVDAAEGEVVELDTRVAED